jgi:hypothetical protein
MWLSSCNTSLSCLYVHVSIQLSAILLVVVTISNEHFGLINTSQRRLEGNKTIGKRGKPLQFQFSISIYLCSINPDTGEHHRIWNSPIQYYAMTYVQ